MYEIEKIYQDEYKPRLRLGLSQLGNPCNRFLWYGHHGYEPIQPEPRMLRLFELGNVIEKYVVISDLKRAGFTITNEQKIFEIERYGITLSGSIDGNICGLHESDKLHILEAKSANDKQFKRLKKLQSYEKWNPKYKAQIHVYMYVSGINQAFVYVYCKNDSDDYQEYIQIDKEYAESIISNAFRAIRNVKTPGRLCRKSDEYTARYCDFRHICFEKGEQ